MPSERLTRLIEHVEISKAEIALGEAIAEMTDLLAEAGVELDLDVPLDEYIASVEHIAAYLDGDASIEELGLTEDFKSKVKAGFKMVFGKLVKVGKKLAHKAASKYLNMRARQSQAIADKYKSRAQHHAAAAGGLSKKAPPRRKPGGSKTHAGARARKALGKPPMKRKSVVRHVPAKPAALGHKVTRNRLKRKMRKPMPGKRMPRPGRARHEDIETVDESHIQHGWMMVFGKLRKVAHKFANAMYGKEKKVSQKSIEGIHRAAMKDAHNRLKQQTASLKASMAASRRARDAYLAQSADSPTINLAEWVENAPAEELEDVGQLTFNLFANQADDLIEEAEYEMVVPEEATIEDYLANVTLFAENEELPDNVRMDLSGILEKMRMLFSSEKAKAKLQGKYKAFRRERSGKTSRGGSWTGKTEATTAQHYRNALKHPHREYWQKDGFKPKRLGHYIKQAMKKTQKKVSLTQRVRNAEKARKARRERMSEDELATEMNWNTPDPPKKPGETPKPANNAAQQAAERRRRMRLRLSGSRL